MLAASPAAASASVDLDGSFSFTIIKPDWIGVRCPVDVGDECGVMQLVGLGPADYVYVYGPTFEPNGTRGCRDIDGILTITLQSDGSRISGALSGVFCNPGESAHQRRTPSYGNPQREDDSVEFADGSGQFEGLHGTAWFREHIAGARFQGTLTGTLTD